MKKIHFKKSDGSLKTVNKRYTNKQTSKQLVLPFPPLFLTPQRQLLLALFIVCLGSYFIIQNNVLMLPFLKLKKMLSIVFFLRKVRILS